MNSTNITKVANNVPFANVWKISEPVCLAASVLMFYLVSAVSYQLIKTKNRISTFKRRSLQHLLVFALLALSCCILTEALILVDINIQNFSEQVCDILPEIILALMAIIPYVSFLFNFRILNYIYRQPFLENSDNSFIKKVRYACFIMFTLSALLFEGIIFIKPSASVGETYSSVGCVRQKVESKNMVYKAIILIYSVVEVIVFVLFCHPLKIQKRRNRDSRVNTTDTNKKLESLVLRSTVGVAIAIFSRLVAFFLQAKFFLAPRSVVFSFYCFRSFIVTMSLIVSFSNWKELLMFKSNDRSKSIDQSTLNVNLSDV